MSKRCARPGCDRGTYDEFCMMHKPRKPMPAPTKRIRQIGKQSQKTIDYVEAWKAEQQPNHEGYYICYIGADWVPYLTAEHPYSKTRHPDKRTNQKLEPVCDPHNALKGSLDIHDFLEKYPEFKKTVKPEYLPK